MVSLLVDNQEGRTGAREQPGREGAEKPVRMGLLTEGAEGEKGVRRERKGRKMEAGRGRARVGVKRGGRA